MAEEEKYVVMNPPPIERRSLMESGMRRRTTRIDVIIVIGFLLGLLGLLSVFLTPVITTLVHHIPDLFRSTGK